ncbi:MAG: HEAT repeat domain-containing protein, partial [Nitrospirales bacterium]
MLRVVLREMLRRVLQGTLIVAGVVALTVNGAAGFGVNECSCRGLSASAELRAWHAFDQPPQPGERYQGKQISSSDPRRNKVRSLIREGKANEALEEYERLVSGLGREDVVLLRRLALAFILPRRQDMREQMRGAAYTALKELNSDEAVPYLEEGLSDGSGLVRTLAAEGLAKLKSGQRSMKFRGALHDQAALVRAAVLKGLGRSGDSKAVALIERSLRDEQGMVRVAAAGALYALGRTERWSDLVQAASKGDRWERRIALRLLGELGDARALPLLKTALGAPQPAIRA